MTSAMAENMVIQIGTTVADDTQLASLPQRNVLEQVLIQRVQAVMPKPSINWSGHTSARCLLPP